MLMAIHSIERLDNIFLKGKIKIKRFRTSNGARMPNKVFTNEQMIWHSNPKEKHETDLFPIHFHI